MDNERFRWRIYNVMYMGNLASNITVKMIRDRFLDHNPAMANEFRLIDRGRIAIFHRTMDDYRLAGPQKLK